MVYQLIPEDVLLQLLSFLPFPFALQARLVCRKWLALLTSPDFLRLWASRHGDPSSSPLWLLFGRIHNGACSLSPMRRLHSLVLSSISCRQQSDSLSLCYPVPASPKYAIGASCHGAILLIQSSTSDYKLEKVVPTSPPLLSVCNPASNRRIAIPSPSHILLLFSLGICADPCFTSFRIMTCGLALWHQLPPHGRRATHGHRINIYLGGAQEEMVAELYDSAVGSWRLLPLPRPFYLAPGQCHLGLRDFVWWSGRFCTLASDHILTYDVHKDQWDSMKPPASCYAYYSTLHAINCSLFMEGGFYIQGDNGRTLNVGISQFDAISDEWLEVSFMPDACVYALMQQSNAERLSHSIYTSFSHTELDQIFFVPNCPSPSNAKAIAVIYHAMLGSWTCASFSVDKLENYRDSNCNMKGLTFQPSLLAISSSSLMNAEE